MKQVSRMDLEWWIHELNWIDFMLRTNSRSFPPDQLEKLRTVLRELRANIGDKLS